MNSTDYAYCRKCIYLSKCGSDHTCDYINQTHHVRGCPPGVGCDRRVNGKKKRLSPVVSPARPVYRKERTNG